MAERNRRSRERAGGRTLRRFAAAALVFLIPPGLGADSLNLTTWYPAPYGVYSQLRSTGNSYFAYQGGSVGIGTTNPSAKLDVSGNGSSYTTGIVIDNPSGGATYLYQGAASPDSGILSFGNNTGWKFHFARTSDGAKFMTIQDNGNVGIGTTNPGAPLTVYGGGEILRIQKNQPGATGTGYIQFVDSSGSMMGYIGQGGSGPNMQFSNALGPIVIAPKTSPALYIGQLPGQVDIGGTAYGAGAKSYINFDDSNWDVEGGVGKIDPASGDVTLWSGTAGLRLTTANGGGIKANDNIYVNGQIVQTSDARLKKDVSVVPDSLKKILSLDGVRYRWKDEKKSPGLKMGLLAQDVEKVFPEAVMKDGQGFRAVDYSGLIAPLINALKEDHRTIEEMKKETAGLHAEIADMRRRLEESQPASHAACVQ